MKIRIIPKEYGEVMDLPRPTHRKPLRPSLFFRTLLKLVSLPAIRKSRFSVERVGMERLGKREPALYLMNHSSFIDMEIVSTVLYPRPFNIITTTDGFIGKDWLLRHLGCIPTRKFVADVGLVRDMRYTLDKLKSSLVLFPEAGYSFDGTATVLPSHLGKCVKSLGVPVVMIRTFGAFHRDPLYNNLQVRDVTVSAREEYLFSPEDLQVLTAEELQARIEEQFAFDSFAWQKEQGVEICEPFRADYLNRLLYKCPHCLTEGQTEGRGTTLRCKHCGAAWELTPLGELEAHEGETHFSHIPDWVRWERDQVREELVAGTYGVDLPVSVYMTVDTGHLFSVGEGRLRHGLDGFELVGCNEKLHYCQKPLASYTLNSDFNWYEIGDMVSIGDHKALYYCFPRVEGDVVAKLRLATEELYKLEKSRDTAKGNA